MAVDMTKALKIVFTCGISAFVAFNFFAINATVIIIVTAVLTAVAYSKFIPLVEAKHNYKYFK